MKVGIIIPSLNEEKNIGPVLKRLKELYHCDLLVLDGNSDDETRKVAEEHGARVVVQNGRGKGNALRQVFTNGYVDADVLVMMDADGSMLPMEVHRLVEGIVSGFDMVKGSRFVRGGYSYDMSVLRRIGNAMILSLVNLLWGTSYTDICYGFVALTSDAVRRLAPMLRTDGFEIETELLIKAKKLGLRIREVPSTELRRQHGKSNLHAFSDGFMILRTVIKEFISEVLGSANTDEQSNQARTICLN